jgi:hypothetical protein
LNFLLIFYLPLFQLLLETEAQAEILLILLPQATTEQTEVLALLLFLAVLLGRKAVRPVRGG